MTPEEIVKIVQQSAAIRKKSIKGGLDPAIAYALGKEPAKVEPPDYYPNYREMVDQYKHIEYHADADIFPKDLFQKRSPNITPEEEDYIETNYKNNTQTAYLDYVNQFLRIFHDSNFEFRYSDTDTSDDSLRNYLSNGIVEFNSLENYMKSIAAPTKVLDPNGVIAVKPLAFNFKFDQDGDQAVSEEGQPIIDDSVLLEPQPVYYRVEQIVSFKFGSHYLILTDENSYVDYNGVKVKAGLVYEWYDTENIWRISQYGKPADLTFNIELWLEHKWGYVPVFQFKGIAKNKKGINYWVSPFLFAVHALDACLLNGSNLQASINKCVYPLTVMTGDECEFKFTDDNGQTSICDSGYVFDSKRGENITCPRCHGMSLKSKLSPLGVILLKAPSTTQPGDGITPANAISFPSPSTETLLFLREQIDTDYRKAQHVLHLRSTNQQASGPNVTDQNITATADVLDQKAQDAFIKPQSDQIFEMYANIAEAIEWQRYGRDASFRLSPPIAFDWMNLTDYLNDIVNKKAAGLPPSIINAAIEKFINGSYWNENLKTKIFSLQLLTDRIMSMSADDVAIAKAQNVVAPWEIILHESADYFITNLLITNPKFFEQDVELQKTQLVDAAKAKADELKPKTTTGNLIDNIVNPGLKVV